MVILKVCGVDCYYGSVKVLEGVSFSVNAGELVGLLGPNGSGKTTLLRAISRTLKPKVGTVLLNEADVYNMKSSDVAKNMAVVPQSSSLEFEFTALDLVLMGRHPHMRRFEREDRTDLEIAKEAMKLTNTWQLAEKPINELSGGERQLVMIARALAQNPKVLLLDEPTSHLDANNQIGIMDLLRKICKEKGIAALAVFHDFNLAARYCDSVILLHKGKIFALGKTDEVLTEENVSKVFSVEVIVRRHPITNSLYIVPISPLQEIIPTKNFKVHVIAGGGTGAPLIKILYRKGYYVTAGVLNLLDSDYEECSMLGIPTVGEAPFSPITNENHEKNLGMVNQADIVILSNVCFGHGNLKNMEAVLYAVERGKKVIIVEETPIQQRDFTKGKAEELYMKLKNSGAVTVKNYYEVPSLLKNLENELSPS
ncbi:MAG: ABC transporter ATP-binding protein [Candidatus Bathyarchaeota archaeon]|nr:ABC transporter ATP-binding protein [Candidatus Bathyarchaeota archaeon]